MMMQARRRNAPRWVHGYVALVFVQSAVFKIVLGGVVGGLSGVAFGVALVWLLDVLLRRDVLAASSVNDA